MRDTQSIRTMDARALFRIQLSSRPDVHCHVEVV